MVYIYISTEWKISLAARTSLNLIWKGLNNGSLRRIWWSFL